MIKDLEKKLSGELSVTREELIELVSSWGREYSFRTLFDTKYMIWDNIEKCEPKECYNLSNLDVSEIDNLDNIFEASMYNGDLSKWDVSNVESMEGTFKCSRFNNDSLKDWNVSNVYSFQYCFSQSKFNGNLSEWKFEKANDLFEMFSYSEFNNDSLKNWNMKNVENISYMFQGGNFCCDISNWEIDIFEINATCVFVNNNNFIEKYGNIYSNNDFLRWLADIKLESKQNNNIEIIKTNEDLIIKKKDFNEGIYDNDKSILYMTSKNDSEETFKYMSNKSNKELIDYVEKYILNDKTKEYIDIKSDNYLSLNIENKIKILNDNIDILNKDFDDNSNLLQKTKTKYSKDESIEPKTKLLIFNELEKKCREANSIINESISKNQDELEKQKINKDLKDTNIEFDIFKTR